MDHKQAENTLVCVFKCIDQNSTTLILKYLKELDKEIASCAGLTEIDKTNIIKMKCHLLVYTTFNQQNNPYTHLVANIDQQISGVALKTPAPPHRRTQTNAVVPINADDGYEVVKTADLTKEEIVKVLAIPELKAEVDRLYEDIFKLKKLIDRMAPSSAAANATAPTAAANTAVANDGRCFGCMG